MNTLQKAMNDKLAQYDSGLELMKEKELIRKVMGLVGSIKTKKKAEASRRNGKLGGRRFRKIKVDRKGDWKPYGPCVKGYWRPLGTVTTLSDNVTGALFQSADDRKYYQAGKDFFRELETKAVEEQL